jgi:hypothetical protein
MPKPKIIKRPMHFPPDMLNPNGPNGIKRESLRFKVPACVVDTTVEISVTMYQGEGNAIIEMRPFLGDGLVPPNKLRWAGWEYDLPVPEWSLLHAILHHPEQQVKALEATIILRPDDHRKIADDGVILEAQKKLNAYLRDAKFHGRIGVKGNFVVLNPG